MQKNTTLECKYSNIENTHEDMVYFTCIFLPRKASIPR
jgi:hypothetical protein